MPDAGDKVQDQETLALGAFLMPLWVRKKLLLGIGLAAGLAGYGVSFLIPPTYLSTTTFMPPQQQQSSAASALAALGPLAGLAGTAAGVKSPAEQYVALMRSVTVSDRILDEFRLQAAYDKPLRVDARRVLKEFVDVSIGKKDGLISVAVEDTDPQRAAKMANRYVDELKRLTGTFAITEAQQRRVFFERQLEASKEKLVSAQLSLQASGFSQGALRAEPKAAAEGYARLKAEVTAAEIRLQALRNTLADTTPEVRQQQTALNSLRALLASTERSTDGGEGPGYVGRYREFKYQEALFEMYARQYELARLDESREGALIQVVDIAQPAEKRFKPRRAFLAIASALVAGVAMALLVLVRSHARPAAAQPART